MSSLRAALVVSAALAVGACTATGAPEADDDGDDTTVDEPTISVTIPPERESPFCSALIDLNDRLRSGNDGDNDDDDGGSVDAADLIVETYRSVLADVPTEIEADFRAVLTELETGVPAPTAAPVTQPDLPRSTDPETGATVAPGPDDTIEYYFPATTPAQRVNAYVEFACRDAANNPGPPATAPGDRDDTDDAADADDSDG